MAFSAIASLLYVGLAARTLGPRGFGAFALVMTYGELIANLAQFQSWKAVVGFGAAHQGDTSKARLSRLLGYTASTDWLSSVVGAFVGLSGVFLIGPLLHWSPEEAMAAAWFGTALLLTSSTTPAGVLRLSNRFDLQVYSEAVAQITRLAGCLAGWATGAGVNWFLCVWALAALLQLVVQWAAVLALGNRPSLGFRALRLAVLENRGLWPFMMRTSISSSLSLFWMQCGTLVAGVWAGPVEAGGFRLAHRFSQAMMKPVEIGTKALFPEFAQLVADKDDITMRSVLTRMTWISAGFASLVVIAAALGGREILQTVAGSRFGFASGFLLLLCISAAINVVGFALEPFQNAHFRSGTVLRAYLVGALFYGALLVLLLPVYGALAAALASIGAALAINLQLGVSTARILARTGSQGGHEDEERASPAVNRTDRKQTGSMRLKASDERHQSAA
jgi:O-antigen/teichoic acid export membrane protein